MYRRIPARPGRLAVSRSNLSKSLVLPAAILFLSAVSSFSQDAPHQNRRHFDDDSSVPIQPKEISVEQRGSVTVHDITYSGADGTQVPAYLVVPEGKGKFASILWGHWLMPHSPSANRKEFLDEAVAIAPSGVVSLLIDAPQVRAGFVSENKSLGPQPADLIAEQVIDLRRGVDLLATRDDVDPKRIAYVGHSWDARTGAILDAVDKRLAAFVFMGGPISTHDNILTSDAPNLVAMRKAIPPDTLRTFLDTYAWADAGSYEMQLGPAPALFQYAIHDDFSPVHYAKQYFQASSGPKEQHFYDSDHALNAAARQDRFNFLKTHLALRNLPAGTIESVPPTK
jgi:cephalosporin-C deacetylase-like acetyl esterase